MTTFTDGIAKGHTLLIKRSPLFLRVVVGADGKVDALDQLNDTPLPSETIHVYTLVEVSGVVHVDRRGGTGGTYPVAKYRIYHSQPKQLTIRMTKGWETWCRANAIKTEDGYTAKKR